MAQSVSSRKHPGVGGRVTSSPSVLTRDLVYLQSGLLSGGREQAYSQGLPGEACLYPLCEPALCPKHTPRPRWAGCCGAGCTCGFPGQWLEGHAVRRGSMLGGPFPPGGPDLEAWRLRLAFPKLFLVFQKGCAGDLKGRILLLFSSTGHGGRSELLWAAF